MAKSLQLKIAFGIHLFILWAATAYAAQNDFTKGIASIPLEAFKYVFMLSMIGGMANTLIKLTSNGPQPKSVWLEVLKDIFCGQVAGMLVFFFISPSGFEPLYQCGAITLGAVAGSRLITKGVDEGLFAGFALLLNRLMGRTPPPPPKEDTAP